MRFREDPTYDESPGMVVETMARLARVCFTASRAYRVVSEHVGDEDVAEALRVLAEERAMMADELRSGLQGFSGDASADMVESQAVVEPIERVLDEASPGDLLLACQESESAVADAYRRALEEEGLPPDVRERLEQHIEALEADREQLLELSHTHAV